MSNPMTRSDLLSSAVPALGGWQDVIEPLASGVPVARSQSLADLLGMPRAPYSDERANRLLTARLGVARSLFVALRAKHAETATHSIRVAIACSIWATEMKLPVADRDALEIAALLHDIGKIGVPDRILLKPAKLDDDEQAIIDRHRLVGVEILSGFCGSLQVLEIVSNAPAWFNGLRMRLQAAGEELPLGARMLAIVDAYDSMVTSQVYRPARSHERAIQDLYECAGAQFDPALVQSFAELQLTNRSAWPALVEQHWLYDLNPAGVNLNWQLNRNFARQDATMPQQLFQQRLLDNMYDAVIFLDANRQIMLWNRGAERLTGIDAASAYQRVFEPQLIHLRNEQGELCTGDACPVLTAFRTGMQSVRRLLVRGYNQCDVMVDAQSVPVIGNDGTRHGAVIVLHDASGQVSLEERCLSLHQKATHDPLTELSNRAEFDRVLALFVDVHLERRVPCSLIIADIDRFKQVNDNYGHQAGDEVIKSFAQLLKAQCKAEDLAARYGGEEFVILCTNCNNAAAAERAEELRRAFGELPQRDLGGVCITASFGVTERQPGDTPETMLRRADRALLLAKDAGRNRVVQLGTGIGDTVPERRKRRRWPWQSLAAAFELKKTWVASVPLRVAMEKLRGFIADNGAEIVGVDGNAISLEVGDSSLDRQRRTNDRTPRMVVDLKFSEELVNVSPRDAVALTQRTRIEVNIHPKRTRDRRKDVPRESAQRVATSLRAYLMATECEATPGDARRFGSLRA
jgi:diguanylate cyclase (GGDEF)-like protein/putative nucleotidyltransferase with HDIG domain